MSIKIQVLALLLVLANGVYSQVNLDSSLVFYWPFTGNSIDESGNNNHANVVGAELTTDRFENENSAYRLIGDGDYITVNNVCNLWERNWSYSLWLSLDVLPSVVDDAFLLTYKNTNYDEDVHLYIDNDNNVKAYISALEDKVSTNTKILENEWTHLGITYSETGISFYINGNFEASHDVEYTDEYSNSDLIISSVYPGDQLRGRIFGKVDDVRFYKRALSDVEVDSLYKLESVDTIITSYVENDKINDFQVYPNPVNIKDVQFFESDQIIIKMEIYNVAGKRMYQEGIHAKRFELNHLNSGIYFCKVYFNEGHIVKKIIVK